MMPTHIFLVYDTVNNKQIEVEYNNRSTTYCAKSDSELIEFAKNIYGRTLEGILAVEYTRKDTKIF